MFSHRNIYRCVKAGNHLAIFFVVMTLACGFGLYQAGHLELHMPTMGQAEPPPLDRGGNVGPVDDAIDGIRQEHWWWMQWLN